MSTCSNPRCASPKPSASGRCLSCQSLFIGTLVRHRYEIKKIVGKGGFGTTYLISDQDCFNEPRILKELSPRPDSNNEDEDELGLTAERLFRREAQVLLNLQHPGIPKLYAYFTDQDYSYLVQDFISGHTLAEEVDKHKHLFSEVEVRQVLFEIADILDYLHTRTPPIVHRDVKPQNLMRNADGRIQLIDFGAVCLAASGANTASQTLIGSPGYAPPEQIFGHPVPQSDLYAAGATVLRLLTGTHPSQFFNNRTQQMEWQSKVSVSTEFSTILSDLLVRDVKKRLSSAALLREKLIQLNADQEPVSVANAAYPVPEPSLSTSGDTLCFKEEPDTPIMKELSPEEPNFNIPLEVNISSYTDSGEFSTIDVEAIEEDVVGEPAKNIFNTAPDEVGDLQQNSIVFLLKKFYQNKVSGYLVCTTENVTKTVYLDEGLVVFASSNIKAERLGEFLLASNRISQKDFEEASELMKLCGIRFGTALVRIGALNSSDLQPLVIEQVSAIVYSLFNWSTGQYRFWRQKPPEEEIKISINHSEIILQGLQRLENTSLLKSWLGDASRKLIITNDYNKLYNSVKLDPKQAFIVSRIDRPISLEEILTMGGLPETEILKTIYGLISVGILEWSKEIPKENSQAKFSSTNASTSSVQSAQPELDIQSAAAFCYEVENTLNIYANATHYSVLEVDRNANLQQIQTAYARLSQKFHPDKHILLSKYNLSIKNELEKIFERITQASHVLSNAKLREEYDLSLRKVNSGVKSVSPEKGRASLPDPQSLPNRFPSFRSDSSSQKPGTNINQAGKNISQNPASSSYSSSSPRTSPTSSPSTSSQVATRTGQQPALPNPSTSRTTGQQPALPKPTPPANMAKPADLKPDPMRNTGYSPNAPRLGSATMPQTPMSDLNRSNAAATAKNWFQKGLEYYNTNQLGQACRAFQAAVTAAPQEAEYQIYLARSLAQMKDFYTEAEQAFYRAIELSPKNADYFTELGLFYQKINLNRQAEEMFSKALEINPEHSIAKRARKGGKGDK